MITNCPRCTKLLEHKHYKSCYCGSKDTKFTIDETGNKINYFGFRTLDEMFVFRITINKNYIDVYDIKLDKEIYLPNTIPLTLDKPLIDQMDLIYKYFQKYMRLKGVFL